MSNLLLFDDYKVRNHYTIAMAVRHVHCIKRCNWPWIAAIIISAGCWYGIYVFVRELLKAMGWVR